MIKKGLPCAKGAVERSETEGLFLQNLFLPITLILTLTIPPGLLRNPTSLYTREAFCGTDKSVPYNKFCDTSSVGNAFMHSALPERINPFPTMIILKFPSVILSVSEESHKRDPSSHSLLRMTERNLQHRRM